MPSIHALRQCHRTSGIGHRPGLPSYRSARPAGILVCGLALLLGARAHASEPLFASHFVSMSLGVNPQAIALGDLNGDGTSDLAVAHWGPGPAGRDSLVRVYLGDGLGGFAPGADHGVGSAPMGVAIADVDGDGPADLVVANSGSGSVSILAGKGDGTFAPRHDLRTGIQPIAILARDLDGDGRADLAVANLGTGQPRPGKLESVVLGDSMPSDGSGVAVLLARRTAGKGHAASVSKSKGGGSTGARTLAFPSRYDLVAGQQPLAVAAGDLNGDGRIDLAIANRGSGSLAVAYAKPGGGFLPTQETTVEGGPTDVAIGDVNGDGKLDIVSTISTPPSRNPPGVKPDFVPARGALAIVLGGGAGLEARVTPLDSIVPFRLQLADLNRDGVLDVVALAQGSISTLLGRGDGTFSSRTSLWLDTSNAFAVGRVDGDDDLDVVCVNSRGMALALLLGNGDGTFGTAQSLATRADPSAVASCDLNGDGRPDLATADSGSGSVSLFLGRAAGGFAPPQSLPASEGLSAITCGDADGDGDADLVALAVRGRASELLLLRNLGGGTFDRKTTIASGIDPAAVEIGDVNGDRKPDLLVPRAKQAEVLLYLGGATGSFGTPQRLAVPHPAAVFTTGDLNRDRKLDLVIVDTHSSVLTVLLGKGDATFTAAPSIKSRYEPASLVVADVDGDGKPDLVIGPRRGLGTAAILAGNGDGTFGQSIDFPVGIGSGTVSLADVDGDGKPDLVTPDSATGTVAVLLGIGNGFALPQNYGCGPNPSAVAIGDFDADGRPDIAVTNRGSNTLSLLRNLGR